jgi:hypothetical protein
MCPKETSELMWLYRNRAAEFEELADKALVPTAQRRYRTIARHYRELADRDERADKARMAEHLELFEMSGSSRIGA